MPFSLLAEKGLAVILPGGVAQATSSEKQSTAQVALLQKEKR